MEENQNGIPFTIKEMKENQNGVLFTIEEMKENQNGIPLKIEEIEENQNAVLFTCRKEVIEENQNGVPFTIVQMEQQPSLDHKLHSEEKSSNHGNGEEQGKDKASNINVEDAAFCENKSVNSNENIILESLNQGPCVDDVHCMEKESASGNDEQHNEEKIKQEVINAFVMKSLEIKPEITSFATEYLKQEVNYNNGAESTEQSLGRNDEDNDNSKKEFKCLVNVVYKCLACSEAFSDRESQEQHKCSTPYRCQICMKVLTSEAELCKHMLCHKNEPCRICGKTFKNKSYYFTHLRAHSGIGNKCVDCGQVFDSSTLFTIHRWRHTGEKPYICEICGKAFVLNQAYQTHIKKHADEKPFECPTCLKQFPVKATLQNHMRIHTGEKPYVCEICGSCFRDPPGIWRHIKNVHEQKQRKCKCHLCPKEYVQNTELKAHLRKHTGERPYECHLCEKKFFVRSCLTKHIKVHEGESFECPVCKKSFSSSSSRNRHVRTHTGETPFGCATCDKSFSLRRDLVKHVFKFQH